jgi:ATP-dependent DNA ligase
MLYYFPNAPTRVWPETEQFRALCRDPRWVAELKKNGFRLKVVKDGGRVEFWNRHKKRIAEDLSEFAPTLAALPDGTVLDAELMTGRRIKGQGRFIYFFDVEAVGGKALWGSVLADRRRILERPGFIPAHAKVAILPQVQVGKDEFYRVALNDPENEGIVLKRLDGKLLPNLRTNPENPLWVKVKRPEAHTLLNGGK